MHNGVPVVAEAQMGIEMDTDYSHYREIITNLMADSGVNLVLKALDKHQEMATRMDHLLTPPPEVKETEIKDDKTKAVEVAAVPV